MAAELRPHGVASIAITPGYLRPEAMLEHYGVTEANWRDAGKKNPNFLESESPLFIGRAVVALAQDADILTRSGQLHSSWQVAREYGVTDADGRRPDWGAIDIDFSQLPKTLVEYMRTGAQIQLEWLDEMSTRTKQFLGRLPTD
jgi:hypothetical protein